MRHLLFVDGREIVSGQCNQTLNYFAAPQRDYLRVEVPIPLADFGATLSRVVVTNNTLELADGTFVLGEARLRSKLFIRPRY
ncbi:unnamed protein product [Ectocarpus sp. 12 AP-2014]